MYKLELTVNGQAHEVLVDLKTTLLEVLRDKLYITSPKAGCNSGDCGTCSVLLDGRLVRSCITNALSAGGKEVLTLEGLARPGQLHPLQTAFHEHYGAQCGFLGCDAPVAIHAQPGPGQRGPVRQSVSLHGLRQDHRLGPGGGR